MGLCVIGCLLMAAPINVKAEAGKPVWAPAGAFPEGFDWIQLTSGEWLKGDLKVLYNDSLEFDSDELDLLKFDWEDVHQVITHEPQSIRIEDPEAKNYRVWDVDGLTDTVKGILHIEGDRVIVHTDEGTKEFDRNNLVSIAPGTERELDYWSAKITLSLDVSQGNSEQLNYSSYAEAKRRTALSRFYIDYRGIYATTFGTVTANSQRASSYYDIFSTRRFFWRPIMVDYFRDTFANIDSRASLGAGLGYTLIDTAKTSLYQFSVEQPTVPEQFHDSFRKLSEAGFEAVEAVMVSARAFFNDVKTVKDNLYKVHHFEKEADGISDRLKRSIFASDLELAHKIHLRYFALNVERLSDRAEEVADRLAIYAIKRTI